MLDVKPLSPDPIKALRRASDYAPYLARLIRKAPHVLEDLANLGVKAAFAEALSSIDKARYAPTDLAAKSLLRKAKQAGHLAIAAGDLSGALPLMDVTGAMSALADKALQAALDYALRSADLTEQGIFVFGLGKLGAGELNYSSDIDIAAFYDPDLFSGGARGPADAAARLIRHVVTLLEERTEDGYVFRTDLRLRPDPSSTPLAVSTRMAENYYESLGQNWERMVWIKARTVAGDQNAAQKFLSMIQPFIWRRHLDYWAINDIYAIKRMINSSVQATDLTAINPDVKLGPGGIREIEFFAQTQQLILGGRQPDLRHRQTLQALSALADKEFISPEDKVDLSASYTFLRGVEHRVQMLNDEQTHQVPVEEEQRQRVVALCGIDNLQVFDERLSALRVKVNQIYLNLFAEEDRQRAAAGNLVFTGVDDDPGTLETLKDLGFAQPSEVISTVRRWHHGRTPATRTVRGRELLTALLPNLLSDMADTGEPDAAFQRFRSFFERLRTGVQTLSMLQAEPALCADLVATLALAPRLALPLGQRPDLLEALINAPVKQFTIDPSFSFEAAMDALRRYHREQAFLIGHGLLHHRTKPGDAARQYSDLADLAIREMADATQQEMERRFGAAPGPWLVCAMGKLGGQEMTAGSDLDLIVLYMLEPGAGTAQWFTRFTQRLITALSADTGEGALYEVDMRLRPSGRAGPVAVNMSSFRRYHLNEAWTWERMALTRLRVVAGDHALRLQMMELLGELHACAIDPDILKADVLDMRRRLARERPGSGVWDMKLAEGGLLDLEFIAQAGLLGLSNGMAVSPSTLKALVNLREANMLGAEAVSQLIDAYTLLSNVQQMQRLALTGDVSERAYPEGLRQRLAVVTGVTDFEALKEEISSTKAGVKAFREQYIGRV